MGKSYAFPYTEPFWLFKLFLLTNKGKIDMCASLSSLQYDALLGLLSFFKYQRIPGLGFVIDWTIKKKKKVMEFWLTAVKSFDYLL